MGDGLQTCFNLFPTPSRINRCVGIFSATLLSMSAAIVHHEWILDFHPRDLTNLR
jgi:hypothetical protein